MSHSNSEPQICPNCNYPAVGNYCAQCGQEVHLHKDTFGALIAHFAGHYLHYDSKFWKTLRALWFSPGLLTKAYWEKKRMRYIPPISLYIFVSFVFFFVGSLVPSPSDTGKGRVSINDTVSKGRFKVQIGAGKKDMVGSEKETDDYDAMTRFFKKRISSRLDPDRIKQKHPDLEEYIGEQFTHLAPKVFFFLIPLLALMFKLLFFRRTDILYADHVIFALHCQTFWFSLWFLSAVNVFPQVETILDPILLTGSVVYLVFALKNAYQIKTFKAISYSVIVSFFYLLFLSIAIALLFIFILVNA